jgi:hypothetical protein
LIHVALYTIPSQKGKGGRADWPESSSRSVQEAKEALKKELIKSSQKALILCSFRVSHHPCQLRQVPLSSDRGGFLNQNDIFGLRAGLSEQVLEQVSQAVLQAYSSLAGYKSGKAEMAFSRVVIDENVDALSSADVGSRALVRIPSNSIVSVRFCGVPVLNTSSQFTTTSSSLLS